MDLAARSSCQLRLEAEVQTPSDSTAVEKRPPTALSVATQNIQCCADSVLAVPARQMFAGSCSVLAAFRARARKGARPDPRPADRQGNNRPRSTATRMAAQRGHASGLLVNNLPLHDGIDEILQPGTTERMVQAVHERHTIAPRHQPPRRGFHTSMACCGRSPWPRSSP